jgi:hypothetical protein
MSCTLRGAGLTLPHQGGGYYSEWLGDFSLGLRPYALRLTPYTLLILMLWPVLPLLLRLDIG